MTRVLAAVVTVLVAWWDVADALTPPAVLLAAAALAVAVAALAVAVAALAVAVAALAVAVAAYVPLAAGLYLVTSTGWSAAERALLRRGAAGS